MWSLCVVSSSGTNNPFERSFADDVLPVVTMVVSRDEKEGERAEVRPFLPRQVPMEVKTPRFFSSVHNSSSQETLLETGK